MSNKINNLRRETPLNATKANIFSLFLGRNATNATETPLNKINDLAAETPLVALKNTRISFAGFWWRLGGCAVARKAKATLTLTPAIVNPLKKIKWSLL